MARAEVTGRKLRVGAAASVKVPPIRGPPTALFSIASFCVAHGERNRTAVIMKIAHAEKIATSAVKAAIVNLPIKQVA